MAAAALPSGRRAPHRAHNSGRFVVEPGRIDVYAGNSSKAELTQWFTVR